MLPITGYADRLSVSPGQTIAFKISCAEAGSFDARLVRVICGDVNPDGPGIREQDLASDFEGSYPARLQPVYLGSYARIESCPALANLESFTAIATIWPTTPEKPRQGLIANRGENEGAGFALMLDGQRGITLGIGDTEVSVDRALRNRSWYRVWASYDASSRTVEVGQQPLAPSYRGEDTGVVTEVLGAAPSLTNGDALFLAARGGSPVEGHYNGKLEAPMLLSKALTASEIDAGELEPTADSVVAAWNFSKQISSARIIDEGPNALDGELINLPARGMMGSRWSGEEMCWRHAPEHYGAIHFHDDDLYDCGWETDFEFTIPSDLKSGIYAARVRHSEHEDMIPFFVRPPAGTTQSDVCVLVPTFTYVIYANHARDNTGRHHHERVANWGSRPWTPDEHPDYGWSTYNFHSDGSGICHSSRLRPIITLRSAYISIPELPGSSTRHFPSDTHLFDWLEAKGHDFDVVTDEDLDEDGVELIAPYRVVITGSHPEYHTANTIDALSQYTRGGGRLMYMGGNGFYWRIARHPELPGVVEIRRGEGGIRAWASEPGEYYNAFDGQYGGLWRRNNRPPQALAGIGFSAQGLFESSYYRRQPGADDPRAAWIFEGVADEILGDFGLCGGGAAGYELDRADMRLGTPAHALVLASSENHAKSFVLVPEEHLTHVSTLSGEPIKDLIRADMVFFETPNGGAVFSTGSITFCGSLSHNRYDNNISRLVDNVLGRFKQPAPFNA